MRSTIGIAAALLLAAASCVTAGCTVSTDEAASGSPLPPQALAVFREAPKLEIFALDPVLLARSGDVVAPGDEFHGYPITGRATLTDAKSRTALVDLVLRGIRDSDGKVAACFNPRHGIRAQHDGRTLELVICYECLSMSAYGDALGAGVDFKGILTSPAVEPAVTKIFESAGLRIAAK